MAIIIIVYKNAICDNEKCMNYLIIIIELVILMSRPTFREITIMKNI